MADESIDAQGHELHVNEVVLTRVGEDAVIRPLDGVTMEEVKRFVEAERNRNRRTIVWTATLLISVFLFFLLIFLSIGIFVVRRGQDTATQLDVLEQETRDAHAALAAVSNRLDLAETVRLDVDRVYASIDKADLERARELDPVLVDVERLKAWMESQREKDRAQNLDALIASRLDAAAEANQEKVGRLEEALETVTLRLDALQAAMVQSSSSEPSREPTVLDDVVGDLLTPGEGGDGFELAVAPEELNAQVLEDAGVFALEPIEAESPAGTRREIEVVNFPSGDRYEGELDNGLMQGWGIYSSRNGDRYDGQFAGGVKAGHGTLVYANGDKYVGAFRGDMRWGRGSLVYANGDRYVGDFANDMRHGHGVMLFVDGTKYAGMLRNGLRHGNGVQRFSNGDIYQGEFWDDQRTGMGTYVFANGSRYIGHFANGVRQGQGRYISQAGEEYIGAFKDGRRDGEGITILPNGDRIRGLWQADQMVRRLGSQ